MRGILERPSWRSGYGRAYETWGDFVVTMMMMMTVIEDNVKAPCDFGRWR